MADHTPGPWHVVRKPVTVSVLDAHGVYITENVRQLKNQDANARLIAAAPALLASCQELRAALAGAMRVIAASEQADLVDCFVEEMARIGIREGVGERADAAVAKAEGR